MRRAPVIAGLAAAALLGAGAAYVRAGGSQPPVLIRFAGGAFTAGNYQVAFTLPDGSRDLRWIGTEGVDALAPTPVEIAAFAMLAFEPTNATFDRFLADAGLPPREIMDGIAADLDDRPANMSFDEAEGFCPWLGAQLGLAGMRLPTEAEWEFAARSRSLSPPWATDNGEWEPGRNVETSEGLFDPELVKPVGSLPPNPAGIAGMADGLYEWVADRAPGDPPDVRIIKGGSVYSGSPYQTIPTRGMVAPTDPAVLDSLPAFERFRARMAGGPVFTLTATARCVVPVTPGDGIGTLPPDPAPLPDSFHTAEPISAAEG